MSAIKDRIMDNITTEARNQVVNGVPMQERGEAWAEFSAYALKEAIVKQMLNPEEPDSAKKKGLTVEERMKRLEAKQRKLAARQGMSYEEWLKVANSLYSIDGNYTVTSIARGPDHMQTWETSSEIAAKERIYKLLAYKRYDHFERDANFAYVPEGNQE